MADDFRTAMTLVLYLGVRARVLGLTFDINMHGSFNRFAALQSQKRTLPLAQMAAPQGGNSQ